MKKMVVILEKNLESSKEVINATLNKLSAILNLKDKYIEVYLAGKDKMEELGKKAGPGHHLNVLSFEPSKNFPRPDIENYQDLGEIYLNPIYIQEDGGDLICMLVHGLLHLLGYDHKNKSDRMKMEAKEKELCQQINS